MYHKGYYLVTIDDGEVTSLDGSHSKKSEVNKALYLLGRLGLSDEKSKHVGIKLAEEVDLKRDDFYSWLTDQLNSGSIPSFKVAPKASGRVDEEALDLMGSIIGSQRK